jgi:hypothetical protein
MRLEQADRGAVVGHALQQARIADGAEALQHHPRQSRIAIGAQPLPSSLAG